MIKNKRIVMVIAFQEFRDEEYFIPKQTLKNAGADIQTVSTKKGIAMGSNGGDTKVDLLVSEVDLKKIDAVIFVGGAKCLKYLDNEDSYQLIRKTVSRNKVLASICISPVILAKAGVLRGKRATVWSNQLEKRPIRALQENGAIYENKPVVIDGKIITANGPAAAEQFAKAIISVVKNTS